MKNWQKILIKTIAYDNTTFKIYNFSKLILQFLNKGVVWALKSAKLIIFSTLFGVQTLFVDETWYVPKLYVHNSNENGI